MTGPSPRVAVVVLTWNGRDDTLACLRSLAVVTQPRLDVIVVDNASTDGTSEAIAQEAPNVALIRTSENLGFAEGNNVGIRHALTTDAEYVFILNNDSVVAPNAINELVRAAESMPNTGALCPLIYFMDPPDLIWFGGADFEPRRGRSGRMQGYRQPEAAVRCSGIREIDRAVGAAMLVPRETIKRTGAFDPELFFLYEDVDWSLRMRQAGLRIVLVPAAHLWHRVAMSQGGREHTPTTAYYGTRNNLVVCSRHAPLSRLASLRREAVVISVHVAGVRHARRRGEWLCAVLQGWLDWRRGRLGPRPN